MTRRSSLFAAGLLTLVVAGAATAGVTVSPQTAAAAEAGAGLYTSAQAGRGKAVYSEKCSLCHLEDLSGDQLYNPGPELAGRTFRARWKGRAVLELFTLTKATMPYTMPGTLTDTEVVDLVAFILQANKFPSGSAELKSDRDVLAAIRIPGGE